MPCDVSPFSYLAEDGEQATHYLDLIRWQTYFLLRLSESRVNVISIAGIPLPTGETHLASITPQLQTHTQLD